MFKRGDLVKLYVYNILTDYIYYVESSETINSSRNNLPNFEMITIEGGYVFPEGEVMLVTNILRENNDI